MRPSSAKPGFHAGNPIANVLVIIAGALVIGASIVLGFFAFLALSAVVLVTAAIIGLRVWWLSRKLKTNRRRESQGVIEGEYRVVSDKRDES